MTRKTEFSTHFFPHVSEPLPFKVAFESAFREPDPTDYF